MSWAAVAVSAISAGVGMYQTNKGNKLAQQAGERPDYEIPNSVQAAMGSSQLKSLQGVNSAVKGQMLQEMDRSRMASLSQVNDRRGGLGAISKLEQGTQDSIRQIGIMDIQQREKNVQGLQDMRMAYAGFEDKKQADTLNSWEQQSQAAAAMKGAGMQNLIGAGTSLATGVASKALAKKAPVDNVDTGVEGAPTAGVDRRAPEVKVEPPKVGEVKGDANSYSSSLKLGQANLNYEAGNKIDASSIGKKMGFGGGYGSNELSSQNIGVGMGLNKIDANFNPSINRQSFGANLFGGGSGSGGGLFSGASDGGSGGGLLNGGSGLDDSFKSNFPLLYPNYNK